ncbi:kyphoscoliosis peptidase-like [Erpetoichthys calabaricus]|uniref:kyphoscoliosis peptidase-like n=1 Tax=Erpetoichthys calabaricus TaxID=27687 RepID=UPI002234809F|nr:kyphoscoliosis peptidase-like [Erpetoichthys calabaricus]
MMLHERLTLTQNILLAVFCFPLLPFYLCYACCQKSQEDQDHQKEVNLEQDGNAQSWQKQNYTEHVYINQAHFPEKLSSGNQEENPSVSVAVEFQPKVKTSFRREIAPQSTEKKTQQDEGSYMNKGFISDVKSKEIAKYSYPWDKSNLKTLQVDLNQLKDLDNYARQVNERNSVEVLVKKLLKNAHSNLEKVRAIWIWITHHIEYDVNAYHNGGLRSSDPNDILKNGKGVCAGYAGLFSKMCSFAEIPCEEVSGYAKGYNYNIGDHFTGSSDHAWNAVYLEGQWHLLDSTWGAGNCGVKEFRFSFEYNEYYFLTHPALFIHNHFPEDKKWQLLNSTVSLKEFEKSLTVKGAFYNLGLTTIKPDMSEIKTENGTVSITIEGTSPTLFLYNLNGKGRDGILTLKPSGMQLDIYPQGTGTHEVLIFAKKFLDETSSYKCICEYQLHCHTLNKEMKVPPDLVSPVGHSLMAEKAGLLQPSVSDPIVNTVDGKCSFRFLMDRDLCFTASLSTAAFKMSEQQKKAHIFIARESKQVEFKVLLPKAGMYIFTIYAKEKSDSRNSYSYVCNYLISCKNFKVKWPGFPKTYSNWDSEYVLVEPLAGVLPANHSVQFKLKIPGVAKVQVHGQRTSLLHLSSEGYWEGTCSTNGCKEVNVSIMQNPNDTSYFYVLTYQVESS